MSNCQRKQQVNKNSMLAVASKKKKENNIGGLT
jgi:hypothetical protein